MAISKSNPPHWWIQGGRQGRPNSFTFVQISAKNRLAHPLWELAPPQENSGSATAPHPQLRFMMKLKPVKKLKINVLDSGEILLPIVLWCFEFGKKCALNHRPFPILLKRLLLLANFWILNLELQPN